MKKILGIIALLSFSFVQAQTKTVKPVSVELKVFLVQNTFENNKPVEKLIEAKEPAPNDIQQHEVVITNNTDKVISNFAIEYKLQANQTYQKDILPENIKTLYSLDQKNYQAAPLYKEIIKNGKKERVKVEPNEYRSTKFIINKIEPKASVKIIQRTVLR